MRSRISWARSRWFSIGLTYSIVTLSFSRSSDSLSFSVYLLLES